MRSIIVFTIFLCLANAVYYFDDPRLNSLTGFDILDYEHREPIFVLQSENRSDANQPISTKTLPSNIIMNSVYSDAFKYYAEVITRNINIKSSKDIKVSANAGYGAISGSFSVESKLTKEWISKSNHQLTRVYSCVVLSQIQLQTSGAVLTSGFKTRIQKVANLIEKNTNVSLYYADYMLDEIIRMFGTHAVDKLDLGGILSKTDAIDMSAITNSVEQILSSSASTSFGKYFGAGDKVTLDHSEYDMYSKATTDVHVKVYGGDPWKINWTYNDWIETVQVKPAVVGMNLIYISDIIRQEYFPELNFSMIIDIRQRLNSRLDVYVANNRYVGCSDPNANNYVEYVNVFNDSLCDHQFTYHFGGLFTWSADPAFRTLNMLTNDYTCSAGFTAKKLLTTSFQGNGVRHCERNWWGHNDCHYVFTPIVTDTYICISGKNQTNGLHFGGIYNNGVPNDITQDKSCPENYIPYLIYHDRDKVWNTFICISSYDSGSTISLPFGGMFTNQYGNYLVDDRPICGAGFERHIVGNQVNAEFTYCIGIGTLKNKKKNIIPPGYGSILGNTKDLFVLYKFENGSDVAIELDPMSNLTYPEQIYALFKQTPPNCKLYAYLNNWLTTNKFLSEQSQIALIVSLSVILPILALCCVTIGIVMYTRWKLGKNGYYSLN